MSAENNLPAPVLAELVPKFASCGVDGEARESTQPANTGPKTNSRGGQSISRGR